MMGAGLAKAAYAATGARGMRDHAPVRVFVYMALTARDTDAAPAFYGGRDALADALAAAHSESGYRAVERAITALVRRGFLKVATKGAPGRNTRYRLLDGDAGPLAIGHGTPDVERRVSKSGTPHDERVPSTREHPTLSDGTPHAERRERPTLSVGLRKIQEEIGSVDAGAGARTRTRDHARAREDRPADSFDVDRFRGERPDLQMLSDSTIRTLAAETIGSARGEVHAETAYVLKAAKDPEWVARAMRAEWEQAIA